MFFYLGIHAKAKPFPTFAGFILSVSIASVFNSLSFLPIWFVGSSQRQAYFYILSNVHVKSHKEQKIDVILVIRYLPNFCKKPVSALILCNHFIFLLLFLRRSVKTIENSHQLVHSTLLKLWSWQTSHLTTLLKLLSWQTNFTCETMKEMHILNQIWRKQYK